MLNNRGYNGTKQSEAYTSWRNMFSRCYGGRQVAYADCEVHEDWWNFDVYEEWYFDNYTVGCDLDKDKLGNGKLYSAETCCFLPRRENAELANAKSYKVRNPEGVVVEIFNMSKFCRENGLHQSCMAEVGRGVKQVYKGWTKV